MATETSFAEKHAAECERHKAASQFLAKFQVNGAYPFCSGGTDAAEAILAASDGVLAVFENGFAQAEEAGGAPEFMNLRPEFFSRAIEGVRLLQGLAVFFMTEPRK